MKNLRILTVLFLLGVSAAASCQMNKTITGNGNVVSRERNVEPFNALRVSTGIDVYLKQGDNNQTLTVEADENLHDVIITEVKNNELHIYTDVNVRRAEKKVVYVTMKEVRSLRTNSAGDIYGETPVKAGELELDANSAGNIILEVQAEKLSVTISSSGDITLSGHADFLDAELSSAGDLKAENLQVREAEVSASSAGNADVNVSEMLTARASSAGDINYYGNPKHVDARSSSAGDISRK